MMKEYYIIVTRDNAGWFWKLKAANHNTLAHSKRYSSRKQCDKTAYALAAKLDTGVVRQDKR